MSLSNLSMYYLKKQAEVAITNGVATKEDDFMKDYISKEMDRNPKEKQPSVGDFFSRPIEEDQNTKTMDPGMWDQISQFIQNNPGTSIGGLAGLGLGAASLGGGGLGVGLLGAAAPVAGYLYDEYKRTGKLPFSSGPATSPAVVPSNSGPATGASAGA